MTSCDSGRSLGGDLGLGAGESPAAGFRITSYAMPPLFSFPFGLSATSKLSHLCLSNYHAPEKVSESPRFLSAHVLENFSFDFPRKHLGTNLFCVFVRNLWLINFRAGLATKRRSTATEHSCCPDHFQKGGKENASRFKFPLQASQILHRWIRQKQLVKRKGTPAVPIHVSCQKPQTMLKADSFKYLCHTQPMHR